MTCFGTERNRQVVGLVVKLYNNEITFCYLQSDDYEKISHFQHYHSRYKNHCHSLKVNRKREREGGDREGGRGRKKCSTYM